jgi:hypothetical protein
MTRPKRKRKANSLFKNFYVMCDGKKFGPYKTKAKANKVGLVVTRVLDKPAKIMAQPKSMVNPKRKVKSKAKSVRRRKTRRLSAMYGSRKRNRRR